MERLVKVSALFAPSMASPSISEAGDDAIASCNCDVSSNHYMWMMHVSTWVRFCLKKLQLQ